MSMFNVKVADIVDEAKGIKSFRLVRPDGTPFDPYPAGAHIDILGPTDVLAQYSLCSPPHEPDSYLVAIKREDGPRGGSAALHDRVTIGSELQISPPRNLLRLASDADRHILIAAGIGITPMLSLAFALHRQASRFELHYFARDREQAAFVDLLERVEFRSHTQMHFGLTRDEQLARLRAVTATANPSAHIYTCGPDGFMARVRELSAPVVGEDHVHIEHFEAAAPADTDLDAAFEVELDTGEVFEVPVGTSIAEVLEDNGIDLDTSCREGICGTCVLDVLEGTPDHRDNCLTTREKKAGDRIAACVSRAKSRRLVVELP
jgi:ferredoxin-NADP reductase